MSNLKKVSDPSILSQLNAPTKVTDHALLAQLNAGENENLLQKVMRYGLKDPAIGILNMGREFANLPNKLSGGRIPEGSPSDYNFGKLLGVENPNASDKIIQFAGQYGPSMALPGVGLGRAGQAISKIPGAGRFISKAISEAIPQAAYSAAQAPQDSLKAGAEAGGTQIPFSMLNELMGSTNPKVKALAKVLAGGGAGLIGRESAKGLGFGEFGSDVAGIIEGALGARGFDTEKDRFKRLAKAADTPLADKKMAAANRLGLSYLTPAEAAESQIAAARQGALGKTEEGEYLLHQKLQGREDSERRAINKTLDMIYTDKLDPIVDKAYKNLNPVNLPTEFPLQYKGNKVMEAAERRVKKSPAYQESLKKYLPENVKLEEWQSDAAPTSLVYWDHVKRALYDMGEEAKRKGTGGESSIYNEARRDLVNQMDTHYPEYAEARGLYERKKVREGLEKTFDRKEVNGTNFYQALASQKKFDELMGHLRNAPEAAQNLEDMRLVFKNLLGSRTIKTAKGKTEYGMDQPRSDGKFFENLIEHVFTKGGNDTAAIQFITSKDWQKQLREINKISGKHLKALALASALTKGVSQAAAQQEPKPMELNLVGGQR